MTKSFNGLTPAEAERLAYLIEEASEVIHIACKILRHGYNSYDPTSSKSITNRDMLHKELYDLLRAMNLMYINKDVDMISIGDYTADINFRYMHHQEDKQ